MCMAYLTRALKFLSGREGSYKHMGHPPAAQFSWDRMVYICRFHQLAPEPMPEDNE